MIERFKKAIRSTGLSHTDLAKELGVKSHDISNMSAGRKQISIYFALLLEKEFCINPCWLFFNRGVMTAQFDLTGEDKKAMEYDELYKTVQDLASRVKEIEDIKYGK